MLPKPFTPKSFMQCQYNEKYRNNAGRYTHYQETYKKHMLIQSLDISDQIYANFADLSLADVFVQLHTFPAFSTCKLW